MGGYDDRDEYAGKPKPLQRELEPGKAIGRQSTGGQLQKRDGESDADGLGQGSPIIHQLQGQPVMAQSRETRYRDHRGVEQVVHGHDAVGKLVEQGLQYHEAQPEQEHHHKGIAQYPAYVPFDQVTAGGPVTVDVMRKPFSLTVRHNNTPALISKNRRYPISRR
jgi:hypothetical protein